MRMLMPMVGIREAMSQEMRKNDKIFLIGEDVTKGCFGVSVGMADEFGKDRIIDTPISEKAFVGAGVGAAALGMAPIVEIMFSDFIACAMDEIMNQAAKMRYMFGGQAALNLTVRMPGGVSLQASAHHSQSLEGIFAHIPGLKIVYPSDCADAMGLMVSSLRDNNPVMFFEHKRVYFMESPVPWAEDEEIPAIPFGKAAIKREGKDITLVATGLYVTMAQAAAAELAKDGIEVEIIDPRTLIPLDKETIFKSLEKTGKFMVVTEENKTGAWSAELVARVAEEKFNLLKKAPVIIGALDTPMAFSPGLEAYIIPRVEDIVAGAEKLMK